MPGRQGPPAENEEHVEEVLDQYVVASVQMRLKNCFKWNPKAPKDVQVWARSLGDMFGGGRQSIREHRAEGRAAVASRRQERRSLKGDLRERGSLTPQSSFQPCAAQVPWLGQAQSCTRELVRVGASP